MKKKWLTTMAATALSATIFCTAAPSDVHAKNDEQTYEVQENDTYWLISRKLGINMDAFIAANSQHHPLNLYKGISLRLPTGEQRTTIQAPFATQMTAAPKAKTVSTSAGELAYSKVIDAKASAYTASAEENGPWGAVDYMGNDLQLGTIAVDPNVIPLGSKIYVTGYDHKGLPVGGIVGKATDTGGAIKGNRIDIFVPQNRQEAMKFGFQDVKVYILD